MKKLPPPHNKRGYTSQELDSICEKLGIDIKDFNRAFGVNTVGVGEDGETLHYACDVLRALHKLGHPLGEWSPWD